MDVASILLSSCRMPLKLSHGCMTRITLCVSYCTQLDISNKVKLNLSTLQTLLSKALPRFVTK